MMTDIMNCATELQINNIAGKKKKNIMNMQNEQCYEKLRLPLNTLKYIEVLIEDVIHACCLK